MKQFSMMRAKRTKRLLRLAFAASLQVLLPAIASAQTISYSEYYTSTDGPIGLAKLDLGTLHLSGSSTYSGATTIDEGKLVVDGSLSAASGITIHEGGALGGHGTVSAVVVLAGGTRAPGNSPGMLTTGDEIWNGDGSTQKELNNATGSAGTNWDYLNINGTLTIVSSDELPFIIDVDSLAAGNAPGFVMGETYRGTILTASGGISGFDADYFVINTSGFLNDAGADGFSLEQFDNTLQLRYTSTVPEPTTAALLGLGLLAFAARRKGARSR